MPPDPPSLGVLTHTLLILIPLGYHHSNIPGQNTVLCHLHNWLLLLMLFNESLLLYAWRVNVKAGNQAVSTKQVSMGVYNILPQPLVLCCVCVCVCVCVDFVQWFDCWELFYCTSDLSVSKLLLLWDGIACNSLLVNLSWVESNSIKGNLQTTKDLGATPLARLWG